MWIIWIMFFLILVNLSSCLCGNNFPSTKIHLFALSLLDAEMPKIELTLKNCIYKWATAEP